MLVDVFNEIQNPRPWQDDNEHQRIMRTVEQAKLADELWYGCWWQVEHHGAEEFSLSSAPELLLTAISQHTRRIRLGHSAVLAPGRINHPIRAAERAAMLDHLSGGSPRTCRKKLRLYADLGIDRLMCFHQVGQLPHDAVMKSIRLVGGLIPELAT